MEKIKFLFEITSEQKFQSKKKPKIEPDKSERSRFSRDMSELAH